MTDQNKSNSGDMRSGVRPEVDEIVSALCDAQWLGLSADEREKALSEQLEKLDPASRIVAVDQQWIDALLRQFSAVTGDEDSRRVDRLMQAIRRGELDRSDNGPGETGRVPMFLPGSDAEDNPLTGSPVTTSGMMGWLGSSALAWALVSVLLVAAMWLSWQVWFASRPAGVAQPHAVAGNAASEIPAVSAASHPEAVQASIGRVDRLESHVIIEREGSKQNAVVGMELLPDDSLDVPAGGSAELTLADHSQAKLGPRTMLSFASSREATLREGFVQIDARNRRADAPLAIATPDARTQIQDAWLSMGAGRKRTQIRVAEGSVFASRRGDGMEVEIPEGYCSTIAQAVDPGPHPSRSGTALLVVSTKAMAATETSWERFDQILADRILGDRMWRSAMPVRVRTYDELRAEDLKDCAVIVLSVFPLNAGVEQKLINLKVPQLPVPIICLEPAGFPVLGLTGPTEGVDFGSKRGPLVVDIAEPGHPLAAGFVGSGLELFAHKMISYWWGRPASGALTIAHAHQHPDRWVLFAHDQGDSMIRGTAPARRVGLFVIPTGADYDSPGLDLVDAAIDWCLNSSRAVMTAYLHHAASIVASSRPTGNQVEFPVAPSLQTSVE